MRALLRDPGACGAIALSVFAAVTSLRLKLLSKTRGKWSDSTCLGNREHP